MRSTFESKVTVTPNDVRAFLLSSEMRGINNLQARVTECLYQFKGKVTAISTALDIHPNVLYTAARCQC
ncbi:MAG: hypothetical protein EZS28_025473 [Streblomastix strix]|uniref:Uncharacterized protein n=1 Tax=Streblomastix strix TaxID=222440 RepID=A0A5J4V979_9EUKA|nr:MAG: hypothetical protein EZS28_025473 [Streblomastix strix]